MQNVIKLIIVDRKKKGEHLHVLSKDRFHILFLFYLFAQRYITLHVDK